jgi:hypothetical protein
VNTPPKFSRLDPGQRRDQILDAANALFAERGYGDVTIEDIASSARVTRGLVHRYFGGPRRRLRRRLRRSSPGDPHQSGQGRHDDGLGEHHAAAQSRGGFGWLKRGREGRPA